MRLVQSIGVCLAIIAVLVTLGLFLDYQQVKAKDRRTAEAISRCGGSKGSIPVWPLGTEYRITFPHPLGPEELEALAELNSLRGEVMIAFVDCEITPAQARRMKAKLPRCHLFRVVDGKTFPLPE